MDPRTQQASGDTQEWGREWGVELALCRGQGLRPASALSCLATPWALSKLGPWAGAPRGCRGLGATVLQGGDHRSVTAGGGQG